MERIEGPNTRNTLSELQDIKRAVTNKTFHLDGYSDALKDITTDIKYLKNKQKQNEHKTLPTSGKTISN